MARMRVGRVESLVEAVKRKVIRGREWKVIRSDQSKVIKWGIERVIKCLKSGAVGRVFKQKNLELREGFEREEEVQGLGTLSMEAVESDQWSRAETD